MTVQELENFYDYNYWANKKILPVVSQLTNEELIRFIAGGYGSIRNTMVHQLNYWKKVENYMREFLTKLDDDLFRKVKYHRVEDKIHEMPI